MAKGFQAELLTAENPAEKPVIYLHASPEDAKEIFGLSGRNATIVNITGIDWNRDLSPWPAPAAFRRGGDFSGGADEYLKILTGELLPEAEMKLGFIPTARGIAGYSLAGLFAVYALFRTPLFQGAASASGSFWFDGFTDKIRGMPFCTTPKAVCLSLGDREKSTKNKRLAAVERCTLEMRDLLSSRGVTTTFAFNAGGHFADIPARTALEIRRLSPLLCGGSAADT